jgi:hypothetical protein
MTAVGQLSPGLYPDISDSVYHADLLCGVPTLSCSLAKVLIDDSPRHAWSAHPRLGNKRVDDPTPEQEYGSACHKLLLGRGAEIVICEEKTWKKDVAKDLRDEAREAGKIPILREKYENALEMRTEFMRQLTEFSLMIPFTAAQAEVVMIYDDGPVRCRAMLDKLLIDENLKRATIFDLKTTGSANPKGLGRLIFNQHYDMQNATYESGLSILRPDLAGRIDFIFLFQETEYPYCLQPATINGESKMLGTSKWTRAWQMWESCVRLNQWPSYSTEIERIEPPAFGLNSEMGAKPIIPK